jgi:hypothetical protein
MTGNTQETDYQLKEKSGEVGTHRISPLARDTFCSDILPRSGHSVKFHVGLTPSPSFSELDCSAGALNGSPAENIR